MFLAAVAAGIVLLVAAVAMISSRPASDGDDQSS
jgi:hypothetical protein